MFGFLKKITGRDRLEAMEQRLAKVEKKANRSKKRIDELENRDTESRKQITELEKQHTRDRKQIRELETLVQQNKKRIRELERDLDRTKGNKIDLEKTLEVTMAETGWDYEFAMDQFYDARERTGCSPKEYKMYRFYDLTEAEQAEVFLMSLSKQITKKYSTKNREFVAIMRNKEKTNEYFADLLGRAWCVNTKITEDAFAEKFASSKRIIYKPLLGNRGNGVEAFDVTPETVREVYRILAGYDKGVVEEFVVQHPRMSELAASSVNTIRAVTVSSNTEPVTADGKMADIAYTSLRIGGGTSIVDNLHGGGVCAAIDMDTGILVTDGVDMESHVHTHHPYTGVKIKGFQVPFYQEAKEMILRTIEEKKIEGYLGWDIAITETGPVLIELNNTPGVPGLSTPWVAEKKGMKHIMEKYL